MRTQHRHFRTTVALITTALVVTACGTGAEGPTEAAESVPVPASASPSLAQPSSVQFPSGAPANRPMVAPGEPWIVFGDVIRDPDEGGNLGSTIFLVRPDGTDRHRLVHNVRGTEIRPTWSPDGGRIAYIQSTPEEHSPDYGLWVVDVDGTNARKIAGCATPCNSIENVDWASDGSIYVSRDSELDGEGVPTTFEIWRFDPETGEGEAVLSRVADT